MMEPKLLLLDEPLSNLDAKLRERMRFELKRMQCELGLTTVYVTHDQSEALALSHEIAVMSTERIVQIGSPRDIYEHPCNKFVVDFVGLANFLNATVETHEAKNSGYRVNSTIGQLSVTSFDQFIKGHSVLISVGLEDIELSERQPDRANVIQGRVDFKVFLGEYMDYQIKVGERQVLARVHTSFKAAIGSTVYLHMNPEKYIIIQSNLQEGSLTMSNEALITARKAGWMQGWHQYAMRNTRRSCIPVRCRGKCRVRDCSNICSTSK